MRVLCRYSNHERKIYIIKVGSFTFVCSHIRMPIDHNIAKEDVT